jgi:hypothetical protein
MKQPINNQSIINTCQNHSYTSQNPDYPQQYGCLLIDWGTLGQSSYGSVLEQCGCGLPCSFRGLSGTEDSVLGKDWESDQRIMEEPASKPHRSRHHFNPLACLGSLPVSVLSTSTDAPVSCKLDHLWHHPTHSKVLNHKRALTTIPSKFHYIISISPS